MLLKKSFSTVAGFYLRERLEPLGLAAGRVFEPIEALGYTEGEIASQGKGSFLNEIIAKGVVVAL